MDGWDFRVSSSTGATKMHFGRGGGVVWWWGKEGGG